MAGAIDDHHLRDAQADACYLEAMARLDALRLHVAREMRVVYGYIRAGNQVRSGREPEPPTMLRHPLERAA